MTCKMNRFSETFNTFEEINYKCGYKPKKEKDKFFNIISRE